MAEIVNKEQFDSLVNSGDLVIVDFFATWCGPCQMYMPEFEKVSETTDIKMVKVDIDNDTELAGSFGVTGVPTTIAIKDGKEVSRFNGFKSAEELTAFIETVK